MPTKLHRVLVSITDEQSQLLRELAELQHRSVASYLREMLDGATPMLRVTLPVMRAARMAVEQQPNAIREAAEGFVRTLAEYTDQIDLEAFLALPERSDANEADGS